MIGVGGRGAEVDEECAPRIRPTPGKDSMIAVFGRAANEARMPLSQRLTLS